MIIVSEYTQSDKRNGKIIIDCTENCICPVCQSSVSHRDWKPRMIRYAGGMTEWLLIERRKCTNDGCGRLHSILPDRLTPYKHYETETITSVLDGDTGPDESIEDFPCDETMRRWQHWAIANLLRIEGYCRPLLKAAQDGDDADILRNGNTITAYMRRLCGNKWLAAILRMIYNSGGFLEPSWA